MTMTTPKTLCEGTGCPSVSNCQRAVRPDDKHVMVTRCALYARREPGASACDMYLPIRPELSTYQGIAE